MAVIRTERLTKHYGGSPALVDLDLEVEAGEVFGYLGPNGSGKTTTIRLLLGLIRPTAGRAEVLGGDAQRDTVAIHRRLAYVPGDAALWPALTGAETLHLLGRIHGTVDTGLPRRAGGTLRAGSRQAGAGLFQGQPAEAVA